MDNVTQQGRDQERALLGAVLRRPALYESISETIHVDNFGWQAYGEVWQAMEHLQSAGMTIDTLTVGDELERMGKLAMFMNVKAGDVLDPGFTGRAALSKLRDSGEPQNAQTYADNILDYSAKWKMAALFAESHYWATNGRRSSDIANDVSKRMESIRTPNGRAKQYTQTLGQAVGAAYDHTDRASRGEIEDIPTGYTDLDNLLGGLSGPDFLVIAGRPGSGKTAFLASLIKNIYDAKEKKRVAIFSLEMSNMQIARRLLAMESGVPFDRQKKGKIQDEEWPSFNNAIEKLSAIEGVYLNDMSAISPNRMRQELRRIGDVDLVIVDYLQLSSADEKTENRNLEVGSISRGFKEIAKDFNVPLLAAAQLSRAVEQRASKEPQLSDLRESGSIEQDSDIVMFIYRNEEPGLENMSKLKIAKHRNGPVGMVDLVYRSNLTRFENAPMRHVIDIAEREDWTNK